MNVKQLAVPVLCAASAISGAILALPTPSLSAAQSATAIPTASADSGIDLTKLPLGDKKISPEPQKGYIYSCATPNGGGGGAFKDGPWINSAADTWDSMTKISVTGSVKWPSAKITIITNSAQQVIASNGLPVNGNTGVFLIQSSDAAYQYDRNPNHIGRQTILLSIPLNPTLSASASCVGGW